MSERNAFYLVLSVYKKYFELKTNFGRTTSANVHNFTRKMQFKNKCKKMKRTASREKYDRNHWSIQNSEYDNPVIGNALSILAVLLRGNDECTANPFSSEYNAATEIWLEYTSVFSQITLKSYWHHLAIWERIGWIKLH